MNVSEEMGDTAPWVSFCISTYKRPEFLKAQLAALLKQTYRDFEIVISDNDPEKSAQEIALSFRDNRIRYFANGLNLGMISSFNRSIDRSRGQFIVMVTDDDPVDVDFLKVMYQLHQQHPGYAVYGGFLRKRFPPGHIGVVAATDFMAEILDPSRTNWFLWSSCIISREAVITVNKIPEYGSPHLADHAFIVMAGAVGGGVLINAAYSSLTSHETNFSKFNFQYYVNGCKGFYETLVEFFRSRSGFEKNETVIRKHLHHWFITAIFSLKRFYSTRNKDQELLRQLEECRKAILRFDFMRGSAPRYLFKEIMFRLKRSLGILR